jgi:hypothetical protein
MLLLRLASLRYWACSSSTSLRTASSSTHCNLGSGSNEGGTPCAMSFSRSSSAERNVTTVSVSGAIWRGSRARKSANCGPGNQLTVREADFHSDHLDKGRMAQRASVYQAASALSAARGFLATMVNNERAAGSGSTRPCSQLRNVASGILSALANSGCVI